MSDNNKTKRSKYSVDNSARNAKRQAARVLKAADKTAYKKLFGSYVARGTARAGRRAAGDFKPVNQLASLIQAPEGKFASKLSAKERAKILGHFVEDESHIQKVSAFMAEAA